MYVFLNDKNSSDVTDLKNSIYYDSLFNEQKIVNQIPRIVDKDSGKLLWFHINFFFFSFSFCLPFPALTLSFHWAINSSLIETYFDEKSLFIFHSFSLINSIFSFHRSAGRKMNNNLMDPGTFSFHIIVD